MDKTKHTPGPYAYGRASGHIYAVESGVHIATINGVNDQGPGPFYTPKRLQANGELLAAAPELLDALETLVTAIADGKTIFDVKGGSMEKARAALAKAKE